MGSLAATALVLVWRDAPAQLRESAERLQTARTATVLVAVTALAATASVGWIVEDFRARSVYRDQPKTRLTADLGSIAFDGEGIRTSSADAAYVREVADCVRQHPAQWTAILPDDAALYPLLNLRDPFPVDWLYSMELVGDAKARILARAQTLDRGGDYLVLFQTGPAGEPSASPGVKLYDYTPPLLTQVRDSLHGTPIQCGALTAVWQPSQTFQ